MLKFESADKNLLVWVKGVTKRPEKLTQEDLTQLKENGDTRVTEVGESAAPVGLPKQSGRKGSADADLSGITSIPSNVTA